MNSFSSRIPARWCALGAVLCVGLGGASGARADGFNPCEGIRFVYAERIEWQFGGTPDADPDAVEAAFGENVETATEVRREWAEQRDEAYRRWQSRGGDTTSFEYRSLRAGDFYYGDTGYDRREEDFMSFELCMIARKKKLKQLIFACVADSHAGEDSPAREETYAYGTGSPAREHVVRHEARRSHPRIEGSCFLSGYSGRDFEWGNIEEGRLRDGDGDLTGETVNRSMREGEDRHERLADPTARKTLYRDALQRLVNGLVESDPSSWGWDYADVDGAYASLPDGTCVISGNPEPLSGRWLRDAGAVIRRIR